MGAWSFEDIAGDVQGGESMTHEQRVLATISSDNDQDHANFEKWWDESTWEAKEQVWLKIVEPYDDPVMEVMSRMAQIAFTDMLIAKERR